MNYAGLIFLLTAHYFCGKGILRSFKAEPGQLPSFCLAMITGVAALSFVPCILQVIHVPIMLTNVLTAVILFTVILSLPLLVNFKKPVFYKISLPHFYEWPLLLVCAALLLISVWRCFYLPPYSRDMLSGPELLAEYAVREKTMISSVFTVDLSTSNNYFKSPYITGLQIIYKLLVCPFGQVWLSILSLSFTLWLFSILRSRLHPFIAGILLLLFICIPELYAYTYMVLYDYSNMIFFFCGYYFLARYFKEQHKADLLLSIFLFGLATYIRTETLILIAMTAPLLLYNGYKTHVPLKRIAYRMFIFIAVPACFYFLCIHVFVRLFIPIPFELSQSVNHDPGNVTVFFERLQDIGSKLIFSKEILLVYGWYVFFFLTVFIADLVWPRRFTKESMIMLYGIAVVYTGLGLIGYLFPLADLPNTTKRGLFKAFPLMLLYLSGSGILLRFSAAIKKWEDKTF